jgi:hypothetical protein
MTLSLELRQIGPCLGRIQSFTTTGTFFGGHFNQYLAPLLVLTFEEVLDFKVDVAAGVFDTFLQSSLHFFKSSSGILKQLFLNYKVILRTFLLLNISYI